MRFFYKIRLRLRSLLKRNRAEHDLGDELNFHLEREIEEKIAQGMTPDEARYAALREWGGVEQVKEQCRDMRGVNLIESLIRDLRYGLRMVNKNRGFTAVAVSTIALGIASTTVVFSVVNLVILQPLRYGHPERLAL